MAEYDRISLGGEGEGTHTWADWEMKPKTRQDKTRGERMDLLPHWREGGGREKWVCQAPDRLSLSCSIDCGWRLRAPGGAHPSFTVQVSKLTRQV